MGTVKLPSKAHAAVLVDYELLIKRPHLYDYIDTNAERIEDLQWVLLVTDPANVGVEVHDGFEWDVVIQNSGSLSYEKFHAAAHNAVKDFSNLIPVMALADYGTDRQWHENYSEVLMVLSE